MDLIPVQSEIDEPCLARGFHRPHYGYVLVSRNPLAGIVAAFEGGTSPATLLDHGDRILGNFCVGKSGRSGAAILAGAPPTIFGDGKQSRDFTYVENVVSANLLAAAAPAEKVAGKVFNVASGQSISLLQLVDELNRITGQQLRPHFRPGRAGDVRTSLADISAAKCELNYNVTVDWREGLLRTLDFYRQNWVK